MASHTSPQPRHGGVSSPPSRANIYLPEWQAAGLEAGKFFPALNPGLSDPFAPDDVPNVTPPADGRIASAGHDFAAQLDETRADWDKHPARVGEVLEVVWNFEVPHKTRRFNYFLTVDGWNPDKPLARAQFGSRPIATYQNNEQPFWDHDLMPADPTVHRVSLPEDRRGYHVLLAVWEVADTGNAFYQVIDLDLA
ncbi:lytic polysaccharide monooxygenase auxiliary activity family 9 protein [Streptosporangium sp. NPDC051022]|uniref:lytic polysaccharide monooxygenase auxiliary activity family 9 protein n=1 Tax=Streptosporangium sp. NPDC051022 TaxID=3155752 RepID=UPI00341D87B2